MDGGELGPDVPLHFTAFTPTGRCSTGPRPRPQRSGARRQIGLTNGIRFVYTGNVDDPEGAKHGLPRCAKTLIGRDGYEILSWGLAGDGRSRACGSRCPGIFEETPGAWGARRRPVTLKTQ